MPTGNNKYSLKNLRHRYRLTITNEDTFEEMVAFKMSRGSVYAVMSFFFMLLVGLTIILIAFTPLKFYIPGYGVSGSVSEYELLKRKTDSLENAVRLQEQYTNGIKSVLNGKEMPRDTTMDALSNDIIKQSGNKTKR